MGRGFLKEIPYPLGVKHGNGKFPEMYSISNSSGWWLSLPLWKIWVRQLGWWNSQLNGNKDNMFQSFSKPPTSRGFLKQALQTNPVTIAQYPSIHGNIWDNQELNGKRTQGQLGWLWIIYWWWGIDCEYVLSTLDHLIIHVLSWIYDSGTVMKYTILYSWMYV